MTDSSVPSDEVKRNDTSDLLTEPVLDRLTRLSAELLDAPVAFLALLDEERTWIESGHGAGPEDIEGSLAALIGDQAFVVTDAAQDLRFRSAPPAAGGQVLPAIASVPVLDSGRRRLGALCVLAPEPNRFREEQLPILECLAAIAAERLEWRNAAAPTWGPAAEAAALGLAILDARGRIVEVNPCACRIAGYGREQLIDLEFPSLFPGGDPAACEEGRVTVACTLRRRDGVLADVRCTTSRFISPQGGQFRMVAFEDVTVLRRLEEKLRSAASLEAVGRLAGGAAHGFNNLLTIITGYGQLLRSSLAEDDPALSYVDEIARAAEGAASLANKLLAFSRHRLGDPERLDLNAVARQVVASLRPQAPRHVHLLTDLSPEPLEVLADRGFLAQAVRDLLVNACEATVTPGRVTLRTSTGAASGELRPGSYALLSVEDEGEGIDPETQKHLFEPFYSSKGVGRGTGLATAYGTLRQCGGDIRIEPGAVRGTVATLVLPLDSRNPPEA
ncbi:MAG TPA: ATP-binding protein [Bryobacteraceae bacterium]|nr:ATP-binding protein [Bryobacteraceae bacterium]